MARKSVNVQEMLSVDPQSIIESLASENSKLKIENLAQQTVINKLVSLVGELQSDDEEVSKPVAQRSGKKTAEVISGDF